MARSNKINMPSSGAGITQYFEESKSRILLSPKTVIAIVILIGIVTIVLNAGA